MNYTITLNKEDRTLSLQKVQSNIKLEHTQNSITLQQIGKRGQKGEPGDPATNLVTSVNGKQGVVVLNSTDVGADPSGSAAQALSDANQYTDNEISAIDTGVLSVTAGTNVTVDNSDPKNPIVSSTGGGGGAVDSVNGQTGVVVLDADDIDEGSTNLYLTSSERTKLSNTSGTNTGDQDLSGYALSSSLATVATSGDYDDLSNTPTIPDTSNLVNGAASATNNNLAVFDSTTGKAIKDSTRIAITSTSTVSSLSSSSTRGIQLNKAYLATSIGMESRNLTASAGSITRPIEYIDASSGNITYTISSSILANSNGVYRYFVIKRTDTSANTVTIVLSGVTVDGSSSSIDLKVGQSLTLHQPSVGGSDLWTLDRKQYTDDIQDSAANRFTNDTDISRLANTSGTNTGDQDLSGYATTDSLAAKGVLAYDVFTSNGTWTKPAGAKVVEVFVIGAGGGGGKAQTGAEGTDRYGGGGGGAGGAVIGQFDADDLTSTVAVTVGVGGAGGTTTGVFDVAPAGGDTSFGSYVQGGGGGGGAYGGMVLGQGSGGAAGASSLVAGDGGTSQIALAFGEPGANGHVAGGSSGSSRNSSNTQNLGLAGGNSSSGAGGSAGGNINNPGGNGVDGTATNGGSGGGGGGKGSVGGNGGFPGGGGGGGGANVTADGAGGNGGKGGDGKAIIITYG